METRRKTDQGKSIGRTLFVLLAVLSFSFIGLAGSGFAYEWPKLLKIASPAMGSNSYNVDLAWANLIEKQTGMKVRLLPEESTSSKWATVKSGQFDMIQDTLGYVSGWMMEGKEGFHTAKGGPFNARMFMVNQAMSFVVFTRGDTGIKSIYDLPTKGKSLRAIHWTVPAGIDIVKAVLAWVDLRVDDVTLVKTGSYIGATNMIAQGAADISCFGIPAAPAFMEAHANPYGLRVLPLDPENNPQGAKKFRQYMAAYSFPKNVAGPKEFVGLTGWGTDGGFVTRPDMDPEWVYQMVKWTFENGEELGKLHPFLKYYMNAGYNKAYADMAFIPLHEGLVRYFKEKGMWSEANERRQQYNVKLYQRYTTGYEECKAEAAKKGIPIDPNNEAWTNLWESYKTNNKIPKIAVLSDEEISQGLKSL